MGHRLHVLLNLPTCANDIVWKILDHFHPDQPFFDEYIQMIRNKYKDFPHYLNTYPLDFKVKLDLEYDFSHWLDNQGNDKKHTKREEAQEEKYFTSIEIRSLFLNFFLNGYPGKPSIAEVSIGHPDSFVWHKELRPLFTRIVHEFARFTNSTYAIYFPDFGLIDDLQMNEFCIDEYSEGRGKPLEEFIQEAKKIAPPLDWNKDYDPEEQPESFWTSDNTIYFYEDLNL